MRRFAAFAGDAVLVAHNARFDVSFLDREVERLTGRRVAAPVVDTVRLARRLLAGRVRRVGLGLARPLLRDLGGAVPPRAARRAGDRRDLARADRPRSGARREDARRSRRASQRRVPGASTRSGRSSPRPRLAGRLPLPRPQRSGAVRRPRARPARPSAVVLRRRAAAAGGGGRPRRAERVEGACSGRSWKRR